MWWLFYLLFFYHPTFGSHFDGGSIRWVPIDKNDTASPVQIMITQTYTYTLTAVTCTVGSLLGTTTYGFNFSLWCTDNCGNTSAGYIAPPILGYCTGSNAGLNLAFVQRTDIVNLTANDYFTISYSILSTAPGGTYRQLALSNGSNAPSSHWNISTTIDIRPRPDNGLINTPPIANVLSPYGIPYNITTQIIIPTLDIDGDDVRCRWGNSTLECGTICFPQTIPATTTLSSNCILTITGTATTGWYCASIQVEDFLNTSTSLQAMSSTAVQFLIYVYTPKNCSSPLLTSPSTCLGVQVGIASTFTYTAINSCGLSSNISSIAVQAFTGIVQGPLVLITPNKTTYAMNITYTPLASQVGLQILCATALDNTNIPSNQYCITFIVGSTVTPTCPSATSTTNSIETSTDMEITSMEAETSSLTSSENVQTGATTDIDATSEIELISTTTTSGLKSKPNNWPLIGSLIGIISLLALLGSCCLCYHFLWSKTARRRLRRQQQEVQHRVQHQPSSEIGTDLTTISQPRKPYQIYVIDTDSATCSNNKNNNHPPTETVSSTEINTIRSKTTKNSIPDKPSSLLSYPLSTRNKDSSSELRQNRDKSSNAHDSNENRSRSTVNVRRVSNTERRQSMSNERKIKQSCRSGVLVTRIKK